MWGRVQRASLEGCWDFLVWNTCLYGMDLKHLRSHSSWQSEQPSRIGLAFTETLCFFFSLLFRVPFLDSLLESFPLPPLSPSLPVSDLSLLTEGDLG